MQASDPIVASRKSVTIIATQSARVIGSEWSLPGSTASRPRGTMRTSSSACSGRTKSSSPIITRSGAFSERISGSGQPSKSRHMAVTLAISTCQFPGWGATSA